MTPRVLMTTTAYPPSTGGVQGYLADLRSHLRRFEADVVTLWLENRTDWLLGTTVRLAKGPATEVSPGVQRLAWSAGTRLAMAPWAATYYAAIRPAARRLAGLMVPDLERLVSPEHRLIHNHRIGREFLAMASLAIARKRGLPFVLTPYHHPRWRGPRYAAWIDVYRQADAVLTLTAAEQEELVGLGVDRERLHVIGGGGDRPLPGDGARFRAGLGGTEAPLVVFVGQLYSYKGVAELFAAAEQLHARGAAFELCFVGPPTPFSRRFFARRRRPWIHLLGSVDEQAKWDALEAAAVLCVPSRQESFGRVYLEAWAMGKPVIGARIPAVSEVVADGETGLLVEPGSVAELANALERLLADPDLARRLGRRGREEAEGRFSWPAVAARVENLYQSLLEEPPRRRSQAGSRTRGSDRS
jgi:glycosyltransferase involved in cell wall biosynthesis